ncbi:MAG: KR domain-containing protein, partial [Daejeonella sp.]
WSEFYRNQQRKRISLPGYPYEREAYSIDFSKGNVQTVEKTNVRGLDTTEWYSVPVWKRSANIKYLVSNTAEKKTWLIIHDQNSLGDEIMDMLAANGQEVYEVSAGKNYTKETTNKYTIDIADKEHYELMMKDLTANDTTINNIIHLINYSKETSTNWDLARLAQIEDETFFSPLYLQQAFYTVNKLKDIHFSVVANGVFDVVGEKVYAPEKALAIGTCRVLIQEFPSVRAKFIDVSVPSNAKSQTVLAKNIIQETLNDSFETVVAYRNNYRWTEGYNKVQLEKLNYVNYKSNGIYLITGGLGGIGILTAKVIASQVNATFILSYNSPIPAREEWANYLKENKGKSFTRDKIEGVREIEELGSTVILHQVNVSDYEGMKELVAKTEKSIGRINGVIHSAGAVGGGIISLKTEEAARFTFESKFRGTLVLDKVFSNYNLDFLWLYSSITSILGEATRLDYCSANSFLDAFSYYRKSNENDHTTSINWAGWTAVGMAGRWEDTKSAKAVKKILRHSKDLLNFDKQEGDIQTYDVKFMPESDWIINSHFIIGQPTVVGTTFIELAYKYAEILNPGYDIELKNLYFISPLMFEKGKDKKVRFVVDLKNGKCKFSFKTQPFDKDSETDIWHDHFMGEMIVSEKASSSFDLNAIQEKLNNHIDETLGSRIVYNAQDMPLIDLGERWDISNKIYVGTNEWLAELKLRTEFSGDTQYFDFHPALLDKATSYALRYMPGATYLPFSYNSVKAYGKLPSEIYSYVTLSDTNSKNDDAVSFDITLSDLSGTVLMEIKGYTMKQVNDLPASSKTSDSAAGKETANILNTDTINLEEGVAVIKQLLRTECHEQVVIYPCDFNFMIDDNIPHPDKLAKKKEELKSVTKSYYSRPSLSTPYTEPANEMEKTIAQIWQDILGLDKIGRDDTFAELGGNSLLAIQTIANIVDVLEVELSAQVFYDNPTVKGLAEAVVSSIMDLDEIENLEELMDSMNSEE